MCCPCVSKKTKTELKQKYFFKNWLKVDNACEPTNIKWENQNLSDREVRCRSFIMKLVTFILVLIAMIAIVSLKELGNRVSLNSGLDKVCEGNTTKA